MPTPPTKSIHAGMLDLAETAPDFIVAMAAAIGPTALATSLEPWAKAIAHAVNTINTAKTFSTLAKRSSDSMASMRLTRINMMVPTTETRRPAAAATKDISK